MKRLTVFLLFVLPVFILPTVQGQPFTIAIYYFEGPPLTDSCEGGTPIADGDTIFIYHDINENGFDFIDPLAPVWEPGQELPDTFIVNLNYYLFNGEAWGYGAGYFYGDYEFASVRGFPDPNAFYLVADGGRAIWVSQVFSPEPGPQILYDWDWTCYEQPLEALNLELGYLEGDPLSEACSSGEPLSDGSIVSIYYDANDDGYDCYDLLAPISFQEPLGFCVNYNQFTLNGEALGLGQGYFLTEPPLSLFCWWPTYPLVSLYLVVETDTANWYSQTFHPQLDSLTYADWSWTCHRGFNVALTNFNMGRLFDECDGNYPLPDSTPVHIYYDANGDGYDESDTLAPVTGDEPADFTVSYNELTMNGQEQYGVAGYFYTNSFTVLSGLPSPDIFYLIAESDEAIWVSETFSPLSCPDTVRLWDWTCYPVTSVDDQPSPASPNEYTLDIWPNPFNSTARIRFELGSPAEVELAVYNLVGQSVAILVSSQELTAGSHQFSWDASGMASGLYFVRLEAGAAVESQKLLLVR